MVNIRRAGQGDEENIRRLFSICFSRDMAHDEWHWKYRLSPWGRVSYVGEDGKDLVSHFGGIRYAFDRGGQRLWAYQFCDVCTHPAYRGRVFAAKPPVMRLAETFYRENDMDFAFGFPSERHARLHCLVLESTYTKVSVLKKTLTTAYSSGFNLLRVEEGWSGITDGELDALWMRNSLKPVLSISKGNLYLRWRYQKHPVRQYGVFVWRSFLRRSVRCMAVTRLIGEQLNLLDFFSQGTDSINRVMSLIEALAVSLGAKSLAIWLNRSEPFYDILLRSGYASTEGIPLAQKSIRLQAIDPDTFFGTFGYRMGDYDDS